MKQLGDVEDAAQVGVDDLVPGVPVHLAKDPVAGDARVVDEDVDLLRSRVITRAHVDSRSLRTARRTSRPRALRPISRISRQTVSAASTPAGLEPTATSAPADGQRQRAGPADAARAAGDERLLAEQAEGGDIDFYWEFEGVGLLGDRHRDGCRHGSGSLSVARFMDTGLGEPNVHGWVKALQVALHRLEKEGGAQVLVHRVAHHIEPDFEKGPRLPNGRGLCS